MEKHNETRLNGYPKNYVMCFNAECAKAGQCTHRLATLHLRGDDVAGHAVYPTMNDPEACPYHKEVRTIRAAWGFDNILKDVKERDAASLRHALKVYLGGKTQYYRYHHGELLLSPEQQEWITSLMHDCGYTDVNAFDNYTDTVEW